jgi:predicted transcriptional regulator
MRSSQQNWLLNGHAMRLQQLRPIILHAVDKQFSMLKKHLKTDHELTPELYRRKWQLPASYPLVAPNYAKTRSAIAKQFGLGRMRLGPKSARTKARQT